MQCGPTAVAVGRTYRAVVDNGTHVAGESGAFTLTPDGPRSEVINDIDLAHLAELYASATAACAALAEYPGSHVMQPASSLSDQYRLCVQGANAGMTTREVLRHVATGVGGAAALGALWYLRSQAQREMPAPDTPTVPEDAPAPRPVPLPLLSHTQDLAGTLMADNPALSQKAADEVAHECLFRVGRMAVNAEHECSGLPIFASGNDVPEATNHDLEALNEPYGPAWVRLNYRPASETPGSRKWYLSKPECAQIEVGDECDEYPFWATMQGGSFGVPQPHLKPIDADDNGNQGGLYGNFVVICHMNSGDAFLGIPLAPELGIPTQTRVCNGH